MAGAIIDSQKPSLASEIATAFLPNYGGTRVFSDNQAVVVAKNMQNFFRLCGRLFPVSADVSGVAVPAGYYEHPLRVCAFWIKTRDGLLVACTNEACFRRYSCGDTIAVDYQVGRFSKKLRLFPTGCLRRFPYFS